MNNINNKKHTFTPKESALMYAAAGFPILPVSPQDTNVWHWEYYDYQSWGPGLKELDELWDEDPNYKIGYDFGWDIGVICLKPDPLYEGRDGIKNLAKYTAIYGELPRTASCIDRNGTRLLFYRVKPPFYANTSVYPGIEVLNGDYYVTIPGVNDYSGEYHWEEQSIIDGIADADENVMRFVTSIKDVLGPWSDWREDPRTLAMGRVVPKGERHDFLYNNFKLLLDRGYHLGEAMMVVDELNYMCCNPRLNRHELSDLLDLWESFDIVERDADYARQ